MKTQNAIGIVILFVLLIIAVILVNPRREVCCEKLICSSEVDEVEEVVEVKTEVKYVKSPTPVAPCLVGEEFNRYTGESCFKTVYKDKIVEKVVTNTVYQDRVVYQDRYLASPVNVNVNVDNVVENNVEVEQSSKNHNKKHNKKKGKHKKW